jgi:acyl-CoA reductase-like NAD-dependent aldehyde dehydrogenase
LLLVDTHYLSLLLRFNSSSSSHTYFLFHISSVFLPLILSLSGGKRKGGVQGQYYEPTILLNVTHEMRIANEEAFGPVMTIIKFKTEEEVLKMANCTEYALGSSIFTSDYQQAERVCKNLLAGMCTVNDYGMSYLIQSMPFGGTKVTHLSSSMVHLLPLLCHFHSR